MQILKLGGSVITQKHGEEQAHLEAIRSLARVIGTVWRAGHKDIVLVHGAGSFGHALVIKYQINEGVKDDEQRLAAAKTHAACARLSNLLIEALHKEDVPALSLPPNSLIVSDNRRIKRFDDKRVLEALEAGYLPILYGDMVMDESLGMSVCSGDQIIARLAPKAERVVMATNVDGVLREGRAVELITEGNFEEIKPHLGRSGAPDVTGGMAGKIAELLRARVKAYIVNAHHPERVEALLTGKKTVCTEIRFK